MMQGKVFRRMVLLSVCAVSRVSSAFQVTSAATNVVDFGGACVGGYARFSVARRQCAEGRSPVLRIAYATHPDGLGPKGDFCRETAARYLGPDVDLPIWPANIDRYETYVLDRDGDYRAPLLQGLVRYAAFSLDTPGCAVEIDGFTLTNDRVHSEGELDGSFRCSDERLNALWRASVRSCELSAIPSYLATNVTPAVRTLPYLADGAKRDRLVWSGDLWWAERNVFYGFRTDEPYMKGAIRMLAANRTPEGYVQACPWPEQRPPKAGEYGPFPSDEFAAWFVPVLWDYHLYRDDRDLLEETWPVVRDLVGYLDRHRNADGIFEQRPETSKHAAALAFGDSSCHHRAYMNILLWQTYAEAAKIAGALGHGDEASRWRREADGLAMTVRRLFWSADRGHFVLSLEDRSFNFEANALVLANGFARADEAARIIPQLVRVDHGKFQALAVRGSFACGDAGAAMRLLSAHNWFALVDPAWKGAQLTSECARLIRTGWWDEAHPDTAVAGILSASILGIEPVEPGFRKFRFKPHPAGGVTWAEGTVPTPHGPIRASWGLEDGRLVTKLENPPGTARTVDPVADRSSLLH